MIRSILKIIALVAWTFVLVLGCVSIKPNELYVDTLNPKDTLFFISSEIYHDLLTSESWATQSDGCISLEAIKDAAYKGDLGMHIKWNRVKEGCPWLGVGFGWDDWTGKDLSRVKNEAAVEFYVKMLEGSRPDLPWAIGLEDFTGSQAWLGMSTNAVKADKISTEWTRIELPLSEFNWAEQDADYSNIKQIIFNLEAEGEIYMDEVRIVPYTGGWRKRALISTLSSDQFTVDGSASDAIWSTPANAFGNNEVHLAVKGNQLCIALKVKDADPLQNTKEGKDIWDGDAFELAFATDPDVSSKRSFYRTTDQHLGFAFDGDRVKAWDWENKRQLKMTASAVKMTQDGYVFEAMIDLAQFGISEFEKGRIYGLEMAVDHGNKKGRVRQERWNDPSKEGFHTNPSFWGEMYLLPQLEAKN